LLNPSRFGKELKMKKITKLIAIIGIILTPLYAQATIILAPGHTWEYTFTDPTGDSTWNTTTGGGWNTGPAPFGNNRGGYGSDPGFFDYATWWPGGSSTLFDDLWVRTEVDLTAFDLTSIAWDLGVDNGFKLYANGDYVDGDLAEYYTYRWEYSGNFSGVSLNQGKNVFAVALNDWGGLTAFDMQITGTPMTSVPDASIMLLLGTSLIGLAALSRKSKRS
jgi:hypothetical protein